MNQYCRNCGRKRTRVRDAGGGWEYSWQSFAGWSRLGEAPMVDKLRHDTCPRCRIAVVTPPVMPRGEE